jgi:uncharacterized protein involved in response to NO
MIQNFATGPDRPKKNYFFSQPHQPFFLFGIIWAVIDMVIFALGYQVVVPFAVSPLVFHAYSMIFIVFTHFFIGFVFTTFPRFCQSDVIPAKRYRLIFYLMQAGSIYYSFGTLIGNAPMVFGEVLLLITLILVIIELQKVYRSGVMTHNTSDPFWILAAFWFALGTNLLFVFVQSDTLLTFFAVKVAFNNYLLFLVFAVAQRMVPFFSHVMLPKHPRFTATVFWLLVAKSAAFVTDMLWLESVIDLSLGIFVLREFLRWRLPVTSSPAILWVLHLALFWLPAGLILGALGEIAARLLSSHAIYLQTHLLAIGFVTTMLIGFGTRVTLGHSGQAPHADALAKRIFIFVQVVVVARLFYSLQSLFSWDLLWLFDLSLTLWLILFILWGWRYGPVLSKGKKLS